MEKLKTELEKALAIILKNGDIELVDIEFAGSKSNLVVRIYVDRIGGISIDNCSSISRELGSVIEEQDLIASKYRLEVSSPGLDRPLKTKRDFDRNVGRQVKIDAIIESEAREFDGEILKTDEKCVFVGDDDDTICISFEDIKKALIQIKW